MSIFAVPKAHHLLPSRSLLKLSFGALSLGLNFAWCCQPAWAHGAAGSDEPLRPGEFRARPVVTLQGHGGFDNNLSGRPQHYAIDGQFGAVMEWGLPHEGRFAIEAQIGPAFVWGEAEHFYGRIHVEEGGHDDHHGEEHPGHEEGYAAMDQVEDYSDSHDEHDIQDHLGNHEEHHDEAQSEGHGHHSGSPYRRADLKGYLKTLYQPHDRLEMSFTWWPYYVTEDQGEDRQGLKHEIGAQVTWALGDGDVNFALGDGLESIIDGLFLSVENRTGWESEGTYLGNYTDGWLGFGFNIDQLRVTLSGGPRFYSPGSYAGLSQRTDWGGELELEYPIRTGVVLFAHWEPMYSAQGGSGWGMGWQHHIDTGISFSF